MAVHRLNYEEVIELFARQQQKERHAMNNDKYDGAEVSGLVGDLGRAIKKQAELCHQAEYLVDRARVIANRMYSEEAVAAPESGHSSGIDVGEVATLSKQQNLMERILDGLSTQIARLENL
jgi:hypothetical protein